MAHVMLSYQWDSQATVSKIYDALSKKGIPCWMDIKGGMSGSINEAMAEGVENAAAICPFLTTSYQNSKNCKKELNYAETSGVEVIPVMLEKDFKATGWLGIATAGLLWQDFRKIDSNIDCQIDLLATEIRKRCPKLSTLNYKPSNFTNSNSSNSDSKVAELEAKLKKQESSMKQMEKRLNSTSLTDSDICIPANGCRIFTKDGKVISTKKGKHSENRSEIIISTNENKNVDHLNIGCYPVCEGEVALKIYSTASQVIEVDQGDEKKRWEGKNLGKFNYPKNGKISVMTWHGVPSQKWVIKKSIDSDFYVIHSQGNAQMCLGVSGGSVKLEKVKVGSASQLFRLDSAGPLKYSFKKAVEDIKNAGKSVILGSSGKPFTSDWGDAGLASPNGKCFHQWPLPVNLNWTQKSVQWQLMRHGQGCFHVCMDVPKHGWKAS